MRMFRFLLHCFNIVIFFYLFLLTLCVCGFQLSGIQTGLGYVRSLNTVAEAISISMEMVSEQDLFSLRCGDVTALRWEKMDSRGQARTKKEGMIAERHCW